MTTPHTSAYTPLLGRLSEMQKTLHYAAASGTLAEAERAIVTLEKRLAEFEAAQYVPGIWHCHTCSFTWVRQVLNPATGDVGVNDEEEFLQCPNDKERMERLTWKEQAESIARVCEGQVQRAVEAEERATKAEAFASKVERGEVKFAEACDRNLSEIAAMDLGKRADESLADAVRRVVAERNALLSQKPTHAIDRELFEELASYAATVRTDRQINLNGVILCSQTLEWCDGLKSLVELAAKELERTEVRV